MLKVDNLKKKFVRFIAKNKKQDFYADNGISFQVKDGERCLIHDPKYYILDEATSGLDIISSQIILDFIKEEKGRGKIILYSTHYMEEAENICDRVLMINKGEVIKEGTPDEVKKNTKTTNLRDAFFKLIGGAHE